MLDLKANIDEEKIVDYPTNISLGDGYTYSFDNYFAIRLKEPSLFLNDIEHKWGEIFKYNHEDLLPYPEKNRVKDYILCDCREECYECDGTGEIECSECGHERDCDECEGTGFVGDTDCLECCGLGKYLKEDAYQIIYYQNESIKIRSEYDDIIRTCKNPRYKIVSHPRNCDPNRKYYIWYESVFVVFEHGEIVVAYDKIFY